MKFFKMFLFFAILVSFGWGCSTGKGSGSSGEEVTSTEDTGEETDFVVDSQDEDLKIDEGSLAATEPAKDPEGPAPAQEESSFNVAAAEQPKEAVMSGDTDTYVVNKGETLMMIAFKLYGDYTKWVDIKHLNPGINHNSLTAGEVLKYHAPAKKFVWEPSGDPYLIKKHDTLARISNDKYGTFAKWKALWENNKPLIRDPNLIFAGFTIYYIPQRDLASEL